MSDTSASATAWPAARPTGISPIQHPAWEDARNDILDLAAEGPVTAVIVGPPGTGKSWLLRELASALGDHGFPTMMLMQGDLPLALSSGAALLVDNASLMKQATRAELAAQEHGVVILAAPDWPHDDSSGAPAPVIIPLRPLRLEESVSFAAEWLQKAGLSASAIDPDALFSLAEESEGVVGTLVQSLGETVTAWRQPAIPIVEQPRTPEITLADLIADASAGKPIEPALVSTPRRHATSRKVYRPVLAASAIAALILLGWLSMPVAPPAKIAAAPVPPPPTIAARAPATPVQPLQQAETTAPAQTTVAAAAPTPLPPLRRAETPAPALAPTPTPAESNLAPPPLVAPPPPDLDAADIPAETQIPAPLPAIATAPPVVTPTDPAVVAAFDDPVPPPPPRKQALSDHAGSPGLVLIAQPGDTLASLYGSVYRDRNAPPFEKVIAANPGPFKPGAIVVFPEPPGGWQRLQR